MSPRAAIVTSLFCLLPACGGTTTLPTGETSPSGEPAHGGSAGNAGEATAFPTGTWTACADGLSTPPSGSDFLNVAALQTTATLTVAKDAGALLVTYVDQNGTTSTLRFDDEGGAAASLEAPGILDPVTVVACVQGPGAESSKPATLTATSGAMTTRSGAVFLALDGSLGADTGPCGAASSPGSLWIACYDGPSAAVDAAPPSPTPSFPIGAHACRSQIETEYTYQRKQQYLASGSEGAKVMLAQDGAELTVAITNDTYVTGTIHFAATSVATAASIGDPTLSAPCNVPVPGGSSTPEPLGVTSASVVVDGSTLFVSFVGTMPAGSSCPGAKKVGTLICTNG